MSDTQFAAYEAKCATAARLSAEILPYNKQVLFEALAAAGINIVTIAFDGSGDSGQFEEPVGYDAENREVAIPTGDITVKSVDFDTGTVSEQTTTVGDFIETLACDFLEGDARRLGKRRGRARRIQLFARRSNDHARLQRALHRIQPL